MTSGCRRNRGVGRRMHHVTAIKQAARVGTTCSTVGKSGKLADPLVSGEEDGLAGRCEGKGRRRSTTLRTTRTCVWKTITRVHALASRTRTHAHACATVHWMHVERNESARSRVGCLRMFESEKVTLSLTASLKSRGSFSTKDGLIESVLSSIFCDHVTE